MSAGDRDTLAELLAKHDHYEWVHIIRRFECRGCHEPLGDSYPDPAHRAHVADVLLASDWLREQRAEAWDDGAINAETFSANPYRTTEDTDAH